MDNFKPVEFVGTALEDLRCFPPSARQEAGFQIDQVQRGRNPDDWKPMKTVGKGVREISIQDDTRCFSSNLCCQSRHGGVRVALLPKENTKDSKNRPGTGFKAISRIIAGVEIMSNEQFNSVWDAIEDTPAAAENMRLRSMLMVALKNHIEQEGFSQAQAAKVFGVTQPRISDLTRGKIHLFSLDTLVNMVASAGLHVELKVSDAA